MGTFIRIGVDLAKNNFRVHTFASDGAPAVKRKLTRSKMHRFFSQIEATWTRQLTRLILPTKRL
jgi:transposase